MKTVLTLHLFFFAFVSAQAQSPAEHDQIPFIACDRVPVMAVLATQKPVVWTPQPTSASDVQTCFKDLNRFAQNATPKTLGELEMNFDGQIRIFKNPAQFVQFLENHGITVDLSASEWSNENWTDVSFDEEQSDISAPIILPAVF